MYEKYSVSFTFALISNSPLLLVIVPLTLDKLRTWTFWRIDLLVSLWTLPLTDSLCSWEKVKVEMVSVINIIIFFRLFN